MDSFESGHRHHRARKQAGTEVSLGGQEKTQEGGDCWSSCSVSGALISVARPKSAWAGGLRVRTHGNSRQMPAWVGVRRSRALLYEISMQSDGCDIHHMC